MRRLKYCVCPCVCVKDKYPSPNIQPLPLPLVLITADRWETAAWMSALLVWDPAVSEIDAHN